MPLPGTSRWALEWVRAENIRRTWTERLRPPRPRRPYPSPGEITAPLLRTSRSYTEYPGHRKPRAKDPRPAFLGFSVFHSGGEHIKLSTSQRSAAGRHPSTGTATLQKRLLLAKKENYRPEELMALRGGWTVFFLCSQIIRLKPWDRHKREKCKEFYLTVWKCSRSSSANLMGPSARQHPAIEKMTFSDWKRGSVSVVFKQPPLLGLLLH